MQKTSLVTSNSVLNRIKIDIQKIKTTIKANNYNRGGGSAGDYDRHYDRSTGRSI